jgi:glycosyltransferase involved in cell wall biosynthesis
MPGPLRRFLLRMRAAIAGAARTLPPPRDRALVGVLEEGRRLLTGGGRISPDEREAGGNPVSLVRAHRSLRGGRTREALGRADAILAAHPSSPLALDVRRSALARLGEYSAALAATDRLRRVRDDPALAAWERATLGRLVETDPSWRPRIPGPARPVSPVEGRVLHVLKTSVPHHSTGYTTRTHATLLAQRDAGLDPVAVTALGFPRTEGIHDVPHVEPVDQIAYHRLDAGPGYPLDGPYDELLADQAWLVGRLARELRPAVVQASSGFRGYDTALVGLAVAGHVRRPFVYEVRSFLETTWAVDDEGDEDAEYLRRRRDTETRTMLAADAVVTLAESMRDDIVARGIEAGRVHVIPNAVDGAAFTPRPADPALRARLGLGKGPVVGYVSNLDHPREGHEVLLDAVARLRDRRRNVACLIVGGGGRREELERRAERLGIARSTVFTGPVPHADIGDHYALIDVFVVPRRDERAARLVTPLKPFEAMAMARPLVVADLPALREIVAPEDRGLTFAAEDADALAAAIARLLDDPALAGAMAARGREWVLRERTWAANGRRYQELYDRILAPVGER